MSELVKNHISVYENFGETLTVYGQLDFLAFRVKKDSFELHSPFKFDDLRDNPNWELTKYENVYQFIEEDKIVLQYVSDWHAPVAILQWYKSKVTVKWKSEERWKISLYWKWLRLYYCWFLDRLPDYVNMYCGDVFRADICWDMKERLPEAVIDLPNTVTYGEWENRTYKWFWNKNSPLFIRIYDKTLDLKRDHNSMAWLYPEFYTDCCRRLECKFTWRYAKSMSALEWLWVVERNWQVQKLKENKRNYLKSAFYNLLMYIDFVPDRKLQYDILINVKDLCNKKLRKLKDFISCDNEND